MNENRQLVNRLATLNNLEMPAILPGEEDEEVDVQALLSGDEGHQLSSVLLQYLPDSARDRQITQREARRMEVGTRFLSRGLSARVPLTCQGADCPYSSLCPLHGAGYTEEEGFRGSPCPVERMHIDSLTAAYIDQLEIQVDNIIETQRLQEIVEADIMDMRASADISLHSHFDWNAIGITREGDVVLQKQMSVSMEIKQRAQTRKDKLLKEFMATREAKAMEQSGKTGKDIRKAFGSIIGKAQEIRDSKAADEEDDE